MTDKVETEVVDNGNDLLNLQREGENDGISKRISQRDDATEDGEAGEISRVLAVINSARASSDSGEGGALGEGTSSRGGTSVSEQEIGMNFMVILQMKKLKERR